MAISADLGTHLETYVNELVTKGRYNSKSEVLREGVRLVQEREAKLAALRQTLDAAIERGGSHTADEVRQAVRARLYGAGSEKTGA